MEDTTKLKFFKDPDYKVRLQRQMLKEAVSLLVLEGIYNSTNYAMLALRNKAKKNL